MAHAAVPGGTGSGAWRRAGAAAEPAQAEAAPAHGDRGGRTAQSCLQPQRSVCSTTSGRGWLRALRRPWRDTDSSISGAKVTLVREVPAHFANTHVPTVKQFFLTQEKAIFFSDFKLLIRAAVNFGVFLGLFSVLYHPPNESTPNTITNGDVIYISDDTQMPCQLPPAPG